MLTSVCRRRVARFSLSTLIAAVGLGALAAAPAAAALPGSVYTMSNEAAGNGIVVFNRTATGALTQVAEVASGGNGGVNSPPFGGDHLDSQGSVELSDDGHLLFAVNAGSDSLSSFVVLPGGSVQLVSTVPTGDYPISVDSRSGLVYVLNEGELGPTDDASEGTIQGYTVSPGGTLTALPGSVEPLSVTGNENAVPAQIAFDNTGRTLTVTHRAPLPLGFPFNLPGSSRIDTFVLNADGTPGPAVVNAAVGDVPNDFAPFGFAFDPSNRLLVTNAFGPSISSYAINTTTGALTFIPGGNTTVPGTFAPCWIAITPDGRFAFLSNTGSDDITRLSIATDGTTTVLGTTALPGAGSAADIVLSPDGRFLTVLSVVAANLGPPPAADTSQADTYAVGTDGSLTLLADGQTPATLAGGVTGLAASAADATPPDTTITAGPADGSSTNDTTPAFSFAAVPATEPNPTFTCSVDGGAAVACSSPFATPALANGPHTFSVAATDFGGNTDATPATRTFTVDTVAPDTTINAGPANGSTITDRTPTFGFTASEAGSSFRCRVDGGALAPCTTPFTTPTLGAGAHSFAVAAVDAAGNADATPATRAFTVQIKRPQPGCPVSGAQRVGTNANNTLNGTAAANVIFGLGGNDIINGRGGRDCLYGGSGRDRLNGGAGGDRLFGNSGNDRLTDTSGRDVFSAGAGTDRINARDSTRAGRRLRDTVRCGAGRRDLALVDRRDTVSRDCEIVLRR
jgi:hypothetical protein